MFTQKMDKNRNLAAYYAFLEVLVSFWASLEQEVWGLTAFASFWRRLQLDVFVIESGRNEPICLQNKSTYSSYLSCG